jgi:hypothetical protein
MPGPVNVRRTDLIESCLNCISRLKNEDGDSYCARKPEGPAPWHEFNEGEPISLESVTCDRCEVDG